MPYIVFAVALVWRVAYLIRLHGTLLFGSRAADAGVYWEWSEHVLRHGLAPPGPFFLAPLYPYVLAVERALVGSNLAGVLVCQALIGAAAVALLSSAATTLTRPTIGLVIGIVLSLFRGAVFFDGLLLPESLLFALECLLIWIVSRASWAGSTRAYLAYGLLVGVIAQGRAVALPLIALLPVLGVASGLRSVVVARRVLLGLLACVLMTVPSTVANFSVTREIIPFTYSAGMNLYIGNNPMATGAYVDVLGGTASEVIPPASATTGGALDGRPFLKRADGIVRSPGQSSSAWSRLALANVQAQPGKTLRTTGRKLLLLLNNREVPQIENVDAFEAAAGPVGAPLVGQFGVIAAFGLVGIPLALRRSARERWMVGYVAVLLVATLPFFVTDRYRHHLVPGLAILAALALDRLAGALEQKSISSLIRLTIGLVVAGTIVWLPMGGSGATREWGLAVDRGTRLLTAGAPDQAVGEFRQAERLLRGVRLTNLSPTARTEVAEYYVSYASALEAIGDTAQAIEMLERGTQLSPGQVEWLGRLHALLVRAGRVERSAAIRERLQREPGGEAEIIAGEGWQAAARGDWDGARERFRSALAKTPTLTRAWEGLLRVEIQADNLDQVEKVLSEARRHGLDETSASIYEAFLLMRRGDGRSAHRIVDRIDPRTIADPNLKMLRNVILERTGATQSQP